VSGFTVYLIASVFLVIMIAIAAYGTLKQRRSSTNDLFIAERSIGPVITAITIFATLQSGFSILGFAGLFYLNGVGASMAVFVAFTQAMIIYVVFRRIWIAGKKYNLSSQADYFSDRFESPVFLKILIGIIGLVAIVAAHFSVQLNSLGIIMQTMSNGEITYVQGMIFLAIGMVIVTLIGGMRGISFVDFILGILMLVGLTSLAVIIFTNSGQGFTDIYQNLKTNFAAALTVPGPINYFTPQMIFSFFISYTFGAIMLPHMFVKTYITKSIKSYKTLPLLYMGATFPLFILIFWLIGPLAKAHLADVTATDTVVPLLIANFVNSEFVQGLLFIVVIAAIISTASGALLALSQIITIDVYKTLFKGKTEKHYYWVGNIGIIAITLIGLVLAINPPGAIAYIVTSSLGISATLFIPAVLGLYWKRLNKHGVIAGVISGIVVYVWITFILNMPQASFLGFNATVWAVLVEVIVLVVVTLFTPPPSQNTQLKYIDKINYSLYGVENLSLKQNDEVK